MVSEASTEQIEGIFSFVAFTDKGKLGRQDVKRNY